MLDVNQVRNLMGEKVIKDFFMDNGTQCRFVSLTLKTPVVKIKVGNPWNAGAKTKSGLYKLSRKIGLVNANYNTSVRRRVAEKMGVTLSEVVYENGEVWYEHLKDASGKALPVVQHKDSIKRELTGYGLQYFPHKSFNNTFVNDAGEVIPKEDVKPWLYAESERPDFKPCVIAPYIRNILQIKTSGVIIEVPEFEEAEAILAQ